MTTSAPASTSSVADCVAMSVVVSPESRSVSSVVKGKSLPVASMSLIASLTPATSGGPRKARLPVAGRIVPTWNVPSASDTAPPPDDALGAAASLPPPEHPARTSALAPTRAMPPRILALRVRGKTFIVLLAVNERWATQWATW